MASKSTTSSTDVKLVWNSPLDSEETFEVKMAELKTTLIKESIFHCVSESNSNDRLAARPRSADAQSPSYATRYAAWVMRAAWLLQDNWFLKVYKFLTAEKCTFLRKRRHTAIYATTHALCTLVFIP